MFCVWVVAAVTAVQFSVKTSANTLAGEVAHTAGVQQRFAGFGAVCCQNGGAEVMAVGFVEKFVTLYPIAPESGQMLPLVA